MLIINQKEFKNLILAMELLHNINNNNMDIITTELEKMDKPKIKILNLNKI